MTKKAIGVDIGGTHITAGLFDLSSNHLKEWSLVREKVDAQMDASQIITKWAACIRRVEGFDDYSGTIGIAMPGPFNYPEGISLIKNQGKYDALYEQNVKKLLADELGLVPANIFFKNDAACFLQGEVACGVAAGTGRAIGITLGTGLGSTRYFDGCAEDADLWKTPYKEGIIEDYLSTSWFVSAYQQQTGKSIAGVKDMVQPGVYNQAVRSIFIDFADNLTAFLKMFIKMDSPEVVVIGGNIAKAHSFYLSMIRTNLKASGMDIPIHVSQLGERAALIGAAYASLNKI